LGELFFATNATAVEEATAVAGFLQASKPAMMLMIPTVLRR
jgi:hypothetical protein